MRVVWALLLITGCSFAIGRQATTPEGDPHADCSVPEIATTVDGIVAIGAATLGAVWIRDGNQQTPEQRSEHGDVVTLIGAGVEAIAATFVGSAFYGHAKSSDCEALRRRGRHLRGFTIDHVAN